jgi:hypothetical protein
MHIYTIYLINGNKAEVFGDSIEADDRYLTIFDQNNKVVARFKWPYMTGFVTN